MKNGYSQNYSLNPVHSAETQTAAFSECECNSKPASKLASQTAVAGIWHGRKLNGSLSC